MENSQLHGRDPGREGAWSGGDVDALLTEWHKGAEEKAARRDQIVPLPEPPEYRTITTVVVAHEANDVIRVLRRHPDVMFASSEPGVTAAALAAGAEPDDWVIVPGER